ncbi:MAG: class I SAM-dependent RNA methyltransferase [Actinobacteria bacterium]|nr:class I SAM-dependent RNA methyltransferase [Actinomycetota bacterium]
MSRRPPLSREDTDVRVEGFTHGGEGVARIEGKAVFIPGTIPGETVRVRVTDDRRNWARAEVVDVLEASPHRVVPPCPYVPACGGCDLQHVAPDHQRELKTRVVREQLERLGRLEAPPVEPTRPVGPDLGYRNSARLHAAEDGRLGFHREGSHDVVPIDRCLILASAPQALRDEVGDATGAAEVSVRAHPATGTAAAVLTPGPGPLATPDGPFDLLLRQPDGSTIAMRGDGVLTEEVAGHRFSFPADGFFQVNSAGAGAIVATVLEVAGDLAGALVWDLYAGVGLLSLPLAATGGDVTAVEGHAGSCDWARRNAEAAGLPLRVVHEPVEAFTRRVRAGAPADETPGPEYDAPDVVVLDPPRVGAGTDVCGDLAALRPGQIVYVSCDPAALARDARTLADLGYGLRRAVPLDLFPQTHHVEVVALFAR